MKTASALLQIFALSALLAMHVAAPAEFRMPGVRKALQTMEPAGTASAMRLALPAMERTEF